MPDASFSLHLWAIASIGYSDHRHPHAPEPLLQMPPPETIACIGRYAAAQEMAPHADGELRISVVLGGRLCESVGSREAQAQPGSVAIKPAHVIHRNRFGPEGAVIASVGVPAALAEALPAARLDQWRWIHGGPWGWQAARMLLDLIEPAPGSDGSGRLLEWLSAGLADPPAPPRQAPAWLRRVRQRIDDAAGAEAFGLAALAAGEDRHPVHLARMFRRHFGCSVSEYQQAARIAVAVRQIGTHAPPLAEVAATAGYTDQSHLTRACQRLLGRTPGRLRQLVATARPRTPA